MQRVFACLPILCLAFGSLVIADDDVRLISEEITHVTSFGLDQHCWFYPSDVDGKVPLLVTLPMMSKTHDSYEPLLRAMKAYIESDSSRTAVMPNVLSFDLRGHGKSTAYKGDTLTFQLMQKKHWLEVPPEVTETIATIIADTCYAIAADDITVVGSSIGANTAAEMTELLPGVKRIVMLSPGEDYRGLVPAEYIKAFDGTMLIMVGQDDSRSRISSENLQKYNSRDNLKLRIYDGPDHGTDIINRNDRAMQDLVEWLFKR